MSFPRYGECLSISLQMTKAGKNPRLRRVYAVAHASGYPLVGCSPAEPTSVSPGNS